MSISYLLDLLFSAVIPAVILGAAYFARTYTLYRAALVAQLAARLYNLMFGVIMPPTLLLIALLIVFIIILLAIAWKEKTIPQNMLVRGISIACAMDMVAVVLVTLYYLLRFGGGFSQFIQVLIQELPFIASAVFLVLIHFPEAETKNRNVPSSYTTPESQLAMLKAQLEAGAISLETYNKSKEDILRKVK